MQIKTTRLLKDWAGRLVRRAGWVDPHAVSDGHVLDGPSLRLLTPVCGNEVRVDGPQIIGVQVLNRTVCCGRRVILFWLFIYLLAGITLSVKQLATVIGSLIRGQIFLFVSTCMCFLGPHTCITILWGLSVKVRVRRRVKAIKTHLCVFRMLFYRTVCFPWRYTTHNWCVFYSPLSGFSLLAYEVTWSHTAMRHSR